MAEHSSCLLNWREISNVHFPPLFLVVSVGFVKDSESVNEVNLVAVVQVEISGSRSRPVTVRSVNIYPYCLFLVHVRMDDDNILCVGFSFYFFVSLCFLYSV